MAARVNTKFVIGLGAAMIGLVSVVAYVGIRMVNSGAQQNVERGDKAMQAGDVKNAIMFYGRAVHKEQGNPAWIQKWLGAIEAYTPATPQALQDSYSGDYLGALRAMCDADRGNVAPFKRYFEERYRFVKLVTSHSLADWEALAREQEEMLKLYRGDEAGRKRLLRYRGLARAGMLEKNPDLSDDLVGAESGGLKDVNDALSVDPNDPEAIIAASMFERALAERAANASKTAEAEKWTSSSRKRLQDAAAAHPDWLRVRVAVLSMAVDEARRALTAEQAASTTGLDLFKQQAAGFGALGDTIAAAPARSLDPMVVLDVTPIISAVAEGGHDRAEALLTHVKEGHADDPMFLLGWARYEMSRIQLASGVSKEEAQRLLASALDKSDELAKEVVALPNKTVSLDALILQELRKRAVRVQVDSQFIRWEQERNAVALAQDAAEREARAQQRDKAIAKVRELRSDLVSRIGESSPEIKSVDARLLYATGDVVGARTLISEYNRSTGYSDAPLVLFEAQLLQLAGNNGEEVMQKYKRVLQLDRYNLAALQQLATLKFNAQQYNEAVEAMDTAAQMMRGDPRLAELAQKYREVASASARGRAPGGAKLSANPTETEVIVLADQRAQGVTGNLEESAKVLREGMAKLPKSEVIPLQLANVILFMNKPTARDDAKQVIEDALKANPTGERLLNAKAQLDKPQQDPFQAALDAIDKSSDPDHIKYVKRWRVYMIQKKPDEAGKAVAEAVKLAPENPIVLDAQFDDALYRKDMEMLAKLVDKAVKLDADHVGGDLYKARFLLASGKTKDAIAVLRDVVTRDNLNLVGWRLLGASLLDDGQPAAAVDALKKAVDIKSDDILSVNACIKAMVACNQQAEALALARKSDKGVRSDPEFAEWYLTLESNAPGGSREAAIQGRERFAAEVPGNGSNKAKLAALYINMPPTEDAKVREENLKKAGAIIEGLRKDKPQDITEITTLELAAALEAKLGRTESAIAMLKKYLADTPEDKRNEELYINISHLLQHLGEYKTARDMLESGRKYQDPKKALIDREMGDQFFGGPYHSAEEYKANYEGALAAYQRVLDSGSPDDDMAVRMRMMECCLKLQRFADVFKISDKLPKEAQSKATIILLQAEAAAGMQAAAMAAAKAEAAPAVKAEAEAMKHRARALRYYDQAVAAEPKNPVCYLKRGDYKFDDRTNGYDGIKEAQADYDQIVRVDPSSVIGRLRQVKVYRVTGRDELAVAKLKETLPLAVRDAEKEELSSALVAMLDELGKPEEAAAAAEDAAKQFPQRVEWRVRAGQEWGRAGNWAKASDLYASVWREAKQPDYAVLFVEALLNAKDVRNAHNVLTSPEVAAMFQKYASDTEKILPLRMLRARTLAAQNRHGDARQEIKASVALVRADALFDAMLFMSGVGAVYPQLPDQLNLLSELENDTSRTGRPLPDFLSMKFNEVRLRDTALHTSAVAALEALAKGSKLKQVQAACWSLLGTLSYQEKKWEEARERFQRGVDLDPTSVELHNNLAYVLGVKMNKGDEAIKHAIFAVQNSPQNSGFFDTLGACYLSVQNWDQADFALTAGMRAALNDGERVPLYLHQGWLKLGQKDTIEARNRADRARDLMDANPKLRDQYQEDLRDLQKAIDSK